jgi:hypothetical protein
MAVLLDACRCTQQQLESGYQLHSGVSQRQALLHKITEAAPRTRAQGIGWQRDGFDVLKYMNDKTHWLTLPSQKGDIGSPKVIGFNRTALSCITSLETLVKYRKPYGVESSAHGMRFGNTDPEK